MLKIWVHEITFTYLMRFPPLPFEFCALGDNTRMSILFWIVHCPGTQSKKVSSSISHLVLKEENSKYKNSKSFFQNVTLVVCRENRFFVKTNEENQKIFEAKPLLRN